MSKEAEFGSYEAHQPNYDGFKELGKQDDFVFQSLVHMGNASWQMSWALTVLDNEQNVPDEIKTEIRRVISQIQTLKEQLRTYKPESDLFIPDK